jgi:hypothetical protein
MFIEPPCLYHLPAYTVALHRSTELLFGYRKTSNNGRRAIGCTGHQVIDEPYRKNRKRFPGPEKRINMLLSLEPLIYFESITNGKKF